MNLTASHKRIPYPLTISRGQYTFKGAITSVKNLSGRLGRSSFTQVSGSIDWEKKPYLKVNSGKLQIYPEEIYPWLASFEGLNSNLKNIKSVKGVLDVSTLNLQGPLSDLIKSQYQITGEVRNLTLKLSQLPEIVQASTGNFKLTQNLIFFTDFETKMLDASLRISGHLSDYLKSFPTIDLNFHGEIGLEAIQWISDVVDLPYQFNLKSPLSKEWEVGMDLEDKASVGVSVEGDLEIGRKGHPVTVIIEDEVSGEVLEVNHVESAFLVIEDKRKNTSASTFNPLTY